MLKGGEGHFGDDKDINRKRYYYNEIIGKKKGEKKSESRLKKSLYGEKYRKGGRITKKKEFK